VVAIVLQGRSLREMSREIGVSAMTVQRRLRTALMSLAWKLDDLRTWMRTQPSGRNLAQSVP